jgi:imidazolonepropionase-like amidohydrolase
MRVAMRDLSGAVRERGIEDGCWTDDSAGPVLDLSGLWCLPGLADSHAHLAQDDMVLEPGDPAAIAARAMTLLDGGVLLCFDKGWRDTTVIGLLSRPAWERPDLHAAGRMIAVPGGYYPGFAVETDADGLAAAVGAAVAESAGWVKLVGDWPRRGGAAVANFDQDALRVAVDVAHRGGARVAIHTAAPHVASAAVRAGVDSIEHGLFLTDDDLRLLGARGGAWVPTVLRMEAVVEEVGRERTGGRVVADGLARVRALLPSAAEKGVHVLAGSDLAVPSSRVVSEALRMIDYGLSRQDAVAAVSTAAFRYAGRSAGFEVGEPADLVGFAVHPHDDPTVLGAPVAVIRSGRVRRLPTDGV